MPPPEVERADRAGQDEHVEAAAAAAAAATTAIDIYRDRVNQLEARADQLADRLIAAEARAAAAERELDILRQMHAAADPGRKVTFWEWIQSRRR
jgi:chromosome segregation ATPase